MLGWRRARRRRLRRRPVPATWPELLARRVPCTRDLDDAERAELFGLMHVFLAEKHFEGCGGLELTDEMRVRIAAQACLLLLGRETRLYPRLQTVLVYPGTYVAHDVHELPDGTVIEGPDERAGEAFEDGVVVLSWRDVREDARTRDGGNVVLHEFAHQLDRESGAWNGAPALPDRRARAEWARVLGRAFEQLRQQVARGRPTLLDPYGAESPEEFFAVATEAFFEQAVELQRRQPALYDQLRAYYRQDPAARAARRAGGA